MAYPPLVRQDGFQLPSPAHTASPTSSPDDDRDDQLFMPHNMSFLPEPFRKFAHAHPPHLHHHQPIDFADELATLHERSTASFDVDIYAHFNTAMPYPHPDPFQYRHTPSPTHRSRSRSRAPSVGPTRPARRDRRANSISSHVSSTSPPPRPHPHAIVIPGRGNPMGGFFVPNATSAPPDYNLPTPDSLSHSFGQFSSPYYYPPVNRAGTPSLGISPTDVETLNNIAITTPIPKPTPPTTKSLDPDAHLSEKRRRRRESHNAVERRRRDNINERIGELAGLIPGVLFECDGPLLVPSASGPNLADDMFTAGILSESGMHVLPTEDGLPDLPEEGSMVKKDPCEDGEAIASPMSPASASAHGIPANANASEQSTIKANKGMILRKSVEYIRYLQQLVSVQASRGRDLEERNRLLERELAVLRGDTSSSVSSLSPSVASSAVLSMPSSVTSVQRCAEDLDMEDMSVGSEERSREREASRGRRLGRTRDKHDLEQGMEI